MATDPTNEGHFLALDFDIETGTALTAERPAPCDSYGYAVVSVVELSVQALSLAVPDWCPAGGSQLAGIVLSRSDPRDGTPFIMNDPVDGGTGGRPSEDGACLNVMGNGDVPTTPVEIIESRYPVRIECFEYLFDVAGPGKHRGGPGVKRVYRILEPGLKLNVMQENTVDLMGRGVGGGLPGQASKVLVNPDTDRETEVSRRRNGYLLRTGDTFTALTSGGGGLGDPRERDPAAVLRDVRGEYLDSEAAEHLYAVRLADDGSGSWRVDEQGTAELRAARDRATAAGAA
jgi:N-methylhydantoinase B